jgi:hypothetical protein
MGPYRRFTVKSADRLLAREMEQFAGTDVFVIIINQVQGYRIALWR